MRNLKRFLFIVLLLAWSPALAEKRVALLFSAEKYESLRPLENPGSDANLIEEALEKLDFEITTEDNRSLKRMRQAIENFAEEAAGAAVALVFFAGHGVEIAGENRLLPIDADASSLQRLKETSLPLDELRAAAAKVAKSVLIVLDACRNDPFGVEEAGEGRSATALGADVRAEAKPGLGRIGRAENTLFAFSAAPGETATDGEGENSPFAKAFASFLGTDGLEIRSVLTLVQQEVYDQTAGKQLPYVESGLPSLFFAGQTGPLPEREALLLAMADVTPDMRGEVERVAAANAMPLAPLYGALISADLKALTLAERQEKLAEAAQAFLETRQQLAQLAGLDPSVDALRQRAATELERGAISGARALIAQSIEIDRQAIAELSDRREQRLVSAASSYGALGDAGRTSLDAVAATAAYEDGFELIQALQSASAIDLKLVLLRKIEVANLDPSGKDIAVAAADQHAQILREKLLNAKTPLVPNRELTDRSYWLAKRLIDRGSNERGFAVLDTRIEELENHLTTTVSDVEALVELVPLLLYAADTWGLLKRCGEEEHFRTLTLSRAEQLHRFDAANERSRIALARSLRPYVPFALDKATIVKRYNELLPTVPNFKMPITRQPYRELDVREAENLKPLCVRAPGYVAKPTTMRTSKIMQR